MAHLLDDFVVGVLVGIWDHGTGGAPTDGSLSHRARVLGQHGLLFPGVGGVGF